MVIVFCQMAYNSLTVEGALTLINVVKNTPKTAIEEINICVSFSEESWVACNAQYKDTLL